MSVVLSKQKESSCISSEFVFMYSSEVNCFFILFNCCAECRGAPALYFQFCLSKLSLPHVPNTFISAFTVTPPCFNQTIFWCLHLCFSMNKTKSLPSWDLNYAGLIFCQFYLVNSTTTWMTSVKAVFFPLTPPAG